MVQGKSYPMAQLNYTKIKKDLIETLSNGLLAKLSNGLLQEENYLITLTT